MVTSAHQKFLLEVARLPSRSPTCIEERAALTVTVCVSLPVALPSSVTVRVTS